MSLGWGRVGPVAFGGVKVLLGGGVVLGRPDGGARPPRAARRRQDRAEEPIGHRILRLDRAISEVRSGHIGAARGGRVRCRAARPCGETALLRGKTDRVVCKTKTFFFPQHFRTERAERQR